MDCLFLKTIKMKIKNFLLISLVLTLFTSCPDKTECIQNYIFDIPVEISPDSKILHVGDTLDLIIEVDNRTVRDVHAKRFVDFPEFDPNSWFLMPLLDTFPVIDGFIENEVIIDEKYDVKHINVRTLSSGLFFLGIEHKDRKSILSFSVVFNKTGIYALYCTSGIYNADQTKRRNFPTRCGKTGTLGLKYTLNDSKEFGIDLLTDKHKENEDLYWKGSSGQRDDSTPYYFEVVE